MRELLTQISIFKTIRFNLKYFGIKGLVHRWAIVSKKTTLKKLKGNIILESPKKHCLRIGFGHNELLDFKYERTIFYNVGTIIIRGTAHLNQGFRIYNKGTVDFGDVFVVTGNSSIICMKSVKFGTDCLISWGVSIMDTDFHKISTIEDGRILNNDKDIFIGSHCWICSNVTILKGVIIPNGCIVGSGSVVSKPLDECNSLIIDNKILRKGIEWNH